MIGAALAVAAAAAAPVDTVRRTLTEGIDHAIDYCVNVASGDTATLDGRIALFDDANAAMVAPLRPQIGTQTTADAPQIIQRFARTALHSSTVGYRDIVAIEAGDGVVWLVNTAQKGLCDIAITNVDDPATIGPAITAAVLSNAGWTAAGDRSTQGISQTVFTQSASGTAKEPARLSAMIVTSSPTTGHAIQAELNLTARATAAPASSDK